MIEILTQFDQLLATACGVFVGALGCWFAQRRLQQPQRASRRSYAYSETPAITAAAQVSLGSWNEAEQLVGEMQEILQLVQAQKLPTNGAADLRQAQQTLQRLHHWIGRQKRSAPLTGSSETAAALKQRAAEDELVLQWLSEKPNTAPASRTETPRHTNHHTPAPELALTQIASELLPFNPVAVCLTGKRAEADMSATVERIEKLLASVDPPESMATPTPGLMPSFEVGPTIRDPHGRQQMQADEPQRRRSDQAIIYDTLLRRCLGDDDFAWRMLHKFPTRFRTEIESLATEIRRRAWTSATRRSTQLRGMAANIAADNLRDALANLENVCRQQSATRADQLLEGVHSEFQQVLDFLALASGECPLPERSHEENRPLSRWPAALLQAEDHSPTNLELHLVGRVS